MKSHTFFPPPSTLSFSKENLIARMPKEEEKQQNTFRKKWANLEPVFTAILCNDKHGVSSSVWMQSYSFATTLLLFHHNTCSNTWKPFIFPSPPTSETCMTW